VTVQLAARPWLGWIPDDLGACPAAALDRLATALASNLENAAGLWWKVRDHRTTQR